MSTSSPTAASSPAARETVPIQQSLRALSLLLISAWALAAAGCLPYAAGTTAHPVDASEGPVTSTKVYAVPNGLEGIDEEDQEEAVGYMGIDTEIRFGLDEQSDVGVLVPGFGGVVVNYKRRFIGSDSSRFAMAAMGGTGFINFGQHWHFEATLVASGRKGATVRPYGGLRAMQTLPLSASAVSDTPVVGGFFGMRIGNRQFGISPEVGVYYDEPALDISNDDPILFIPSVTIHGHGFLSDLVP